MSLQVTIADIAEALGINPGTVSRALNNHPAISASTKEKVEQMARKLKYRRNQIASSLRSGQTKLIGVVVPSAAMNFFGTVVHGIEIVANEQNYGVIIVQSNENAQQEKQGIESLLNARVDGILISPSRQTTNFDHLLQVKKSGMPIVMFDRVEPSLRIDAVSINDEEAAYLATRHLIEKGYQKLAHASGPSRIHIFNKRKKGFIKAVQEAGLELNKKWLVEGDLSVESGENIARNFLSQTIRPDAIFAAEDFTALGVLKVAREMGIQVPEDLGVIGFANENFGLHVTPSLSTIDQKTLEMGKIACNLVLKKIANGKPKTQQPENIILDATPIFRESTAKKSTRRINLKKQKSLIL
jgi:LacI family transcriptional regulator